MANHPQLHVKIVPWMNRSEVRHVYEELYSDDSLKQEHALGRIDVWKSRHLHKLPLAFESTADLIRAKVEHERAGTSISDDRHLRSLYSMAILRFVNHVTEKQQVKVTAQPVHTLAAQIGIPEWIVELRHDATHGRLPSLSILRAAADWALHWLKRNFWEVQKEGSYRQELKHTTDTETKLNTLRDLLVEYQQRRFKDATEEYSNTDITDVIAGLDAIFFDLRGEIYEYLLEDGYLMSTEDQLSAMGINTEDLLKDESMILPKKLRVFWKPVVRLLSKHHLVSGFMLTLASAITNENSLRNRQLCGWIIKLTPSEKKKHQFSDAESFTIKDSQAFRHVLKKCALMENPYAGRLIKILTDKVGTKFLSEDKKQLLQKVSSLYFNRDVNENIEADGDLKTIKDLLVFKNAEVDPEPHSDNPWRLCTDVEDWSKYPLGVLPNQKLSYKSLELFSVGGEEETMEAENSTEEACETLDLSLNEDDDTLNETNQQVHESHSSHWSEGMLQYIKQTVRLAGSSGNDYPQVDSEGEGSPKRAIECT